MTEGRGDIGFLLHPREGTGEVLAEALSTARSLGFETWIASRDVEAVLAERPATRLLVTVGGDGTFLLGARLAAVRGVPIVGANRGQLGFLTDLELDQLPAAIAEFAAGRHREQRRTLLSAEVAGADPDDPPVFSELALNEVVVKTLGTNLARLRVDADGEHLGEFDADGVIVATATGSTGYALSAGGPPIDPRLRAIVVVPLAAHAVLTRAVVLPEAVDVAITLERGRAFAAADGHVEFDLAEGMQLCIAAGPELTLIRVTGAGTFLRRLRDKLRFGLPVKRAGEDEPPLGD